MSEGQVQESAASMCEIIGCSSPSTTTRWVMTEKDGRRQIEVCWKHAEGDVDPSSLK